MLFLLDTGESTAGLSLGRKPGYYGSAVHANTCFLSRQEAYNCKCYNKSSLGEEPKDKKEINLNSSVVTIPPVSQSRFSCRCPGEWTCRCSWPHPCPQQSVGNSSPGLSGCLGQQSRWDEGMDLSAGDQQGQKHLSHLFPCESERLLLSLAAGTLVCCRNLSTPDVPTLMGTTQRRGSEGPPGSERTKHCSLTLL